MKINTTFFALTIMAVFSLPGYQIVAEQSMDFRTVGFMNKGYDICYEVVQGDNINNMFTSLGFNIMGSVSKSEFHVLLKNRIESLNYIYLVEADKYIPVYSSIFVMENYAITSSGIKIQVDTSSEYLHELIGFNYRPVEGEIVDVELPEKSAILLPNIFTNITRPNFGSLLKSTNFFDFIPIILGYNYNRYEAEFTTLVLNQSFSVSIYNEGYEDFSISLDADIEPTISLKVSWDKNSGLLESFSLHLTYGNKSSVFVLHLKEVKEILSPLEETQTYHFITNSWASYVIYQNKTSTITQLEDWAKWVTNINQTDGLRYLFQRSGLQIDWNMYVYNKETQSYSSNSPIHDSWISLMPPVLIPVWERNLGLIDLVTGLWEQLKDTIVGFQFILSGVTNTLYTIQDVKLRTQYNVNNSIAQLIWDLTFKYQSNNTQTVVPRVHVQDTYINTTGWLAYSLDGNLIGFSQFFQEYFHSYYVPEEPTLGNNYYFEYYIESDVNNITKPIFAETKPTSIPVTFSQIVFYSFLIYLIQRKRKKKMKR